MKISYPLSSFIGGPWLLSCLLAVGVFATRAEGAVVIRLRSFLDRNLTYSTVVDREGVLIPSTTGFLAVGTFLTLSGDALASATKSQLLADFVGFDIGRFGSPDVLGADGSFNEQIIRTLPSSFIDARVFALMGNGITLDASTQWAILEGGTFPVDPPSPGLVGMSLELPDLLYSGGLRAGSIVPIVENDLNMHGATPASFSLALVPEPSALPLLLLATCLLGKRKRPSPQ